MKHLVLLSCLFVGVTQAAGLPKNLPTQEQIENGDVTLEEIRAAGLRVFATPFQKKDGFGDGKLDPSLTIGVPGNRPGLATNRTPFSRVNGLDSQTCMECHSIRSMKTFPPQLVIGGVGGISQNAFADTTFFDMTDEQGLGYADTNGRIINPPFVFGSGGVTIVAKEMTGDLQKVKYNAERGPVGVTYNLIAKGINFGTVTKTVDGLVFATNGSIDDDLVVRPFGRKGNNATVRVFDQGAMQFHHGMQPEEIVGTGVDADNDGVTDEVTIGEMSALSIFLNSFPPPFEAPLNAKAQSGKALFTTIGCASCHTPVFNTRNTGLPIAFPEVETDAVINEFLRLEMKEAPVNFNAGQFGVGLRIEMYSDLRRHDMGQVLAEKTGGALDPFFITPRLWGIADTAPYMHDGRALTLRQAIRMHGGEGQSARDNFVALPRTQKRQLIAFLKKLRTPTIKQVNQLLRPASSK